MKNTCSSLIQLVTDEDYLRERLPFIDLSRLKFKERDMLEGIFKFWRLSDPEKKSFDIQRMWDGRVRHHLGVRYDAKDGVFDWDYHMRLTDIAPIVHSKEYKEWRHTGVAFKLRDDAPYETPNRTLASGVIVAKGGEKVAQRGYWGDIVNSPYVSIGCECDRKDMFEKKNGAYTKTSCDVAEYNLLQFLRLAFPGSITADVLRTPSSNNGHADKTSSKLAVVEEVVEDESGEGNGEEEKKHDPRGEGKDGATKGMDDGRPLVPDLNIKIFLLPLGSVKELAARAAYHKKFHLMYFSNSMVHHLNECVLPLLREDSHTVIVAETAKYLLELKKEHIAEYCKKVVGMAKAVDFMLSDDTVDACVGKSHLIFSRA
jgi:dynein assembly factor 3